MRGVDWADQLPSYYYIRWQSKKWFKCIFWLSFNLAVWNAYVLESKSHTKRPQDAFSLELGKQLVRNFNLQRQPANSAPPLVLAPEDNTSTKSTATRSSVLTAKQKARKWPRVTQLRWSYSALSVELHFVKIHALGIIMWTCKCYLPTSFVAFLMITMTSLC